MFIEMGSQAHCGQQRSLDLSLELYRNRERGLVNQYEHAKICCLCS